MISLSSFAHNFFSFYPFASPKFTSLADVNRSYDPLGYIRYSQAKLANILFVRELNKRATNVRAVAIHPGFVASSLYEAQPLLRPFVGTFINVEEGAYSTLYAATSPELDEKDLWSVDFGLQSLCTADWSPLSVQGKLHRSVCENQGDDRVCEIRYSRDGAVESIGSIGDRARCLKAGWRAA